MTATNYLQLAVAAVLAVALLAPRLHGARRWLWLRLFHFDPVAAATAAWCRRHLRCMSCGAKLTAEEHEYYGHTCERCEGYTKWE